MATIYCSKSGNDSNNGSTYILSKLTIQAGITAAGAGGTVIVGSGLYNEKLTIGNGLTIYCDGVVVLDGTGLASAAAINCGTSTAAPISILPYTSGGYFIAQNHIATTLVTLTVSNAANISITNAFLLSNTNTNFISGAISVIPLVFTNVIFSGFANITSPTFYGFSSDSIGFYNCTFYNGTNGVMATGANVTVLISQCIFSNYTTIFNLPANSNITYLNDNLYYNITNWIIGASTYTTLAQVQAVNPLYDSRSIVADPHFVDAANNIFYLTQQTPLYPNAKPGVYPYSYTRGQANNPDSTWNITATALGTGWWNPDGNIIQDGVTGYFEMGTSNFVFVVSGITTSPTAGAVYINNSQTYTVVSTNLFGSAGSIFGTVCCTGTNNCSNGGTLTKTGGTGDATIAFSVGFIGGQIWSPVINSGILGNKTTELDLNGDQYWPTNMMSATITTLPNYQTAEVRASDTIFNQNNSTLAWTTVKINIPFTAISGQYVQVRISMMSSDIGA